MLKQYEVGYERKVAKTFTPEQVILGLQVKKTTLEWILRKCAVALADHGGLCCHELRSLKDVTEDHDGM